MAKQRLDNEQLARAIKRFNFAYTNTQALNLAMAAVNELLSEPLTYPEFADMVAERTK